MITVLPSPMSRFQSTLPAREVTYSCGKVPFSGILFDLTVASLRNSEYNLDEATKAAFSNLKIISA